MENQKITRQVSPQWDWLIREVEANKVQYGELKVIFVNGEPVRIDEMLKQKKFTNDYLSTTGNLTGNN